MILLCALAIIAPVHAIQNQEMPEVEMFVRHSIGGYHLLKSGTPRFEIASVSQILIVSEPILKQIRR